MAHMTSSQSDHHEKLRKDDMEAVLQIKRTVEEKMQNPFHPSLATDKLINISKGQILAATTLVDAKRLGLKAMDAATTMNADKIVQPKMETFATHLKKIQKKIDTVKEVLIREESAVTRALCFAQNLSDEARTEAFSYEWLEYPPSLFEPEKNGYSMRKGCKSTYLSTLQAELADSWEPLKELPTSAADAVYVVDAMAFIQRFNTLGSSTFGRLQERYREKLLNMKPRHCTEVHFVSDQYDFGLKSLKGDKRQRRESNINLPEYVPADSMKIPDWKTFLSNPCNKTNMRSYLASRWSQEASWPAGFCLVLRVNVQATRVTQTEHIDVDELYCPNHEEADTRIFAHIASCDDNNAFVIQATNTDIIVLAMYHFPQLPNVVELWVEKNDLFLSIHDLVNESAKAVGKDVLALTDTLHISYILSGCDSVSYPFKRGKKRTVKVALEHVDKHLSLSNCIRHESGPSAHDQVITEARSFFCDFYGKPGYLSLDKLRAHLFASRKLDLRSLPPTEDAFHFHVLRSLCQISLYKQASLSNPVLLPPEEYGRIVDGDRLIPVMKSKPSNPSAAKLKYCKCKKKPNCLRNCPCAKAAVPCIIACACNGDREKCGRLLTDHYDDDDDDEYNETVHKQKTRKNINDQNFQRLNKNRPREITSKVKVSNRKDIINVKKNIQRDPRFDDISGEFNPSIFEKTYSFIDDIKVSEEKVLRKKFNSEKNDEKKEEIKKLINRMENQRREKDKVKKQKETIGKIKREEVKQVKEGKKPFYMKKGVQKQVTLVEKFRELKKTGKLKKYIEKKRKKNAKLDRRKLGV
ncbi:Ribosomal RNA processing protein 36 [Nymphon striatum]|nr:Ribosomal RNA processing protein 36 [Nymphon striatum]